MASTICQRSVPAERGLHQRIAARPAKDLTLQQRVWTRIVSNQGAEFHTARQLPFTYAIEVNALRPYRNGLKINRLAPRSDIDKAIDRCPLTATTDVQGSAVYVAIERVSGLLHGREGTFVLHHRGVMDRGRPELSVSVVPDSGTGALAGISGEFRITIRDGRHFYEFEYQLPDPR
jgi:hypothetical protein